MKELIRIHKSRPLRKTWTKDTGTKDLSNQEMEMYIVFKVVEAPRESTVHF